MFLSVVIPTYKRKSTLARTLEGIVRQSAARDTYEIIVVDDCSTDDTRAYMQSMLDDVPNLVYIRHEENRGRVVTRNDGAKAARGDIVVFLDDDNAPDEGFVEAHRRYHARCGDSHVVVMGNVQYAQESIQGSNFGRYMQSRYLGCRPPKERARLDYDNLPPRCLGVGNCSMRRGDLMAVGLLDDSYRHYGGEDEDLGYRLSVRGFRLIFGEDARSLHYDEVTIRRYKMKLMESAQFGLPVVLNKNPDYLEGTQYRYLVPMDWTRDSPGRIAAKAGVRAIANPFFAFLLEQWARLSDRLGWAYWPPMYRVLSAAWVMRGYRTRGDGSPLVTYGENR